MYLNYHRSNTLTEEQQRTISSPVNFLLDIISREEAAAPTEAETELNSSRDDGPQSVRLYLYISDRY